MAACGRAKDFGGWLPLPSAYGVNLSAPASILSPQGTFGREPAAVKPDDDRYLRAAIQEYDNIAKLGQIIREGPIKVGAPLQGPVHRPHLNLIPYSRMLGDVYLDLP